MSRYRHAVAGRDAHILTLYLFIAALAIGCAGLWHGWETAPEHLTIHNPPDLRSGSTRAWWKVPPASVYSFAFYIWQQVNRWPDDGRKDYKANLTKYQAYLTPSCRRYLKQDDAARKQRHELKDRVRGVYEIPGHGYTPDAVDVLNRNHWIVTLNLEINEYLHGMAVRHMYMRYYLRVERHDVDPQKNPWGLQIDCFAQKPVRLTRQARPKAGTGDST